ncbi:MAG: DNA-processing protein DprA [Candidatus Paceibacterota bacterium]
MMRFDRTHPLFPHKLGVLEQHPDQRWYARGNLAACTQPSIAIVGTRRASPTGLALARTLAQEAARRGLVVVSGLALGIDTAAHTGCVEKNGVTVAVLAHGLDRVYPSSNTHLAARILANNGCLISQYPPGTPSYPNQFVARNRIIAALADAIVIIEAPHDSGSLRTAAYAQEFGRPVCVLPGPPDAPLYQGSIELIRHGALCVRSLDDILRDIPALADAIREKQSNTPAHAAISQAPMSQPARAIYAACAASPVSLSIDKLSALTTLKPQDVTTAVTELILMDALEDLGNGTYRRKI